MLSCTTVGQLLLHLELCTSLKVKVCTELGDTEGIRLFSRLQGLPLRKSHAVTRLGSYSCRGGEPLAIGLQFAQESEQLEHTFLHEIAHFLDHQTRSGGGAYRNPHGQSWQRWLRLLGADAGPATSAAMRSLYQERLKPVARCNRCGQFLKRLRRLPLKQRWLHRDCGGLLVPVE